MKHNLILWIGAVVITFLTGYLDSVTDKYYPVTSTFGVEGEKVSFMFEKLVRTDSGYTVLIRTDVKGLSGVINWREKGADRWETAELINIDKGLTAQIPPQEALTLIEYKGTVTKDGKEYNFPQTAAVELLFLGVIPFSISLFYYLTLYAGLLLIVRTGLEAFNPSPKYMVYAVFAFISYFLFSAALTPFVRTYELNAINRVIPSLTQLFDLRAVLLFLLTAAGMVLLFMLREKKYTALAYAAIGIIIFITASSYLI